MDFPRKFSFLVGDWWFLLLLYVIHGRWTKKVLCTFIHTETNQSKKSPAGSAGSILEEYVKKPDIWNLDAPKVL